MSKNFNVLSATDKWTVGLYLLLILFGWCNIYGASVTEDQTSIFDLTCRSGMQAVWIGISISMALLILFTDSRIFFFVPYILYGITILVLIVTIFVAPDIKGSHSWLRLGPVSIQPAEFSKFITSLTLAKIISQPQFRLDNIRSYAIVSSVILLPMLIIIGQQETGSALVYTSFLFMLYREGLPGLIPLLGLCAVVLFVTVIRMSDIPVLGVENTSIGLFAGLSITYAIFVILLYVYKRDRLNTLILSLSPIPVFGTACLIHWLWIPVNMVYVMLGVIAAAAVYTSVMAAVRWRKVYILTALFLLLCSGYCFSAGYIFGSVLQPHQQMRIKVLLGMADDPTGISYNTNQARIAIGSGGLLGKGFLQGTQTKLKYVPEQDTDFIFCTVGEEWGFLGSTLVLILFLAFLFRLIFLAERQELKFARVYGYCVTGIFAFHLFVNVGMVLGLAPVIGIPLPFFSYGGSSLLSFTILLFIFLKLDTMRTERIRR
ncbi:MAG: rod shape-determining protein RodA [Candidatus Aphodosoma sp.]